MGVPAVSPASAVARSRIVRADVLSACTGGVSGREVRAGGAIDMAMLRVASRAVGVRANIPQLALHEGCMEAIAEDPADSHVMSAVPCRCSAGPARATRRATPRHAAPTSRRSAYGRLTRHRVVLDRGGHADRVGRPGDATALVPVSHPAPTSSVFTTGRPVAIRSYGLMVR